jgi:hypothetical protein
MFGWGATVNESVIQDQSTNPIAATRRLGARNINARSGDDGGVLTHRDLTSIAGRLTAVDGIVGRVPGHGANSDG